MTRPENKGIAWKQSLVRRFRNAYPEQADQIKINDSEIATDPKVLGVPGLWIATKHGDRVNALDELGRAWGNCFDEEATPIAIINDRRNEFVVMTLDNFMIQCAVADRMDRQLVSVVAELDHLRKQIRGEK